MPTSLGQQQKNFNIDIDYIKFALQILHNFFYLTFKKKLNQLYAVFRTQQGRQREPGVKTVSQFPTFCRILEA